MILQLVATLVGEIVLSCKEVNQKSRVAANEALVSIAHSMHLSNPPTLEPGTLAPSIAMMLDSLSSQLSALLTNGPCPLFVAPLWSLVLQLATSQGLGCFQAANLPSKKKSHVDCHAMFMSRSRKSS